MADDRLEGAPEPGEFGPDETHVHTEDCLACGRRGWHTAGGNDPMACGSCSAGEEWSSAPQPRHYPPMLSPEDL